MIRPKLNEYSIAKGVRAFSSTRQGGVSKGVFGAFNINEFSGDNPDDIARNRLLLATELGITPDHIIMPHQVHEAKGIVIDNTWRHLTAEERRQKTEGYDAIMTQEQSLHRSVDGRLHPCAPLRCQTRCHCCGSCRLARHGKTHRWAHHPTHATGFCHTTCRPSCRHRSRHIMRCL